MSDFPNLMEQNRAWAEARLANDPDYFTKLAEGQEPPYLLFACSDSRKCLNTMIGSEPGQLFVHRNIANQVPLRDANVQAVLEYALLHLKVRHVIVQGHTSCGGVGGALAGLQEGATGAWLKDLREMASDHASDLQTQPDALARANRLSEINVVAQVKNVLLSPAYQKARDEGFAPTVHGWIFDLSTGLIRELDLPLEAWKEEGLL